MKAGLLNEKIEIYEIEYVRDDYGAAKGTPKLIYTTRAKVGHISGSRTVINSEIQTPYSKNFVMRIYVPITDTCWIKYEGKYYRVLSIDEDKHIQQKVVVTEIVNE